MLSCFLKSWMLCSVRERHWGWPYLSALASQDIRADSLLFLWGSRIGARRKAGAKNSSIRRNQVRWVKRWHAGRQGHLAEKFPRGCRWHLWRWPLLRLNPRSSLCFALLEHCWGSLAFCLRHCLFLCTRGVWHRRSLQFADTYAVNLRYCSYGIDMAEGLRVRGGGRAWVFASKTCAGITAPVPPVLGLSSPRTLPIFAALADLLSSPCLLFLHFYFQPQRSKSFVASAFLPSSYLSLKNRVLKCLLSHQL